MRILYNMVEKKSIINFDSVSLSYDMGDCVFQNMNLSLYAGGMYGITGTSGAGKTSLLRMMWMDVLPTSGCLTMFEKHHTDFTRDDIRVLRGYMGFVFQDFKLVPHLTAYENIALALYTTKDTKDLKDRVTQMLDWVGLSQYAHSMPPALSGGQQQLLALARTVITHPRVIVADEPTGSLDAYNADRILALFQALNKQGTTIILVTHDEDILTTGQYTRLFIHNKTILEYTL